MFFVREKYFMDSLHLTDFNNMKKSMVINRNVCVFDFIGNIYLINFNEMKMN